MISKEGSKVKVDPSKDSGHMISYKLFSHPKPVGPIIKGIQGNESKNPFDLEGRVDAFQSHVLHV